MIEIFKMLPEYALKRCRGLFFSLDAVPCWVREMDDDAAYMALVTSNTQGELTPLEIGIHALERVEKAQGKRGGGLEEYAKAIGKSRTMLSHFRAAAEVYTQLRVTLHEVGMLMDKPNHLYEIHAAPPETWPLLAEAMLSADWSVKDTHHYVEQVLRFFEKDETGKYRYTVPEERRFFLPMEKVVEKYLVSRSGYDLVTVNCPRV